MKRIALITLILLVIMQCMVGGCGSVRAQEGPDEARIITEDVIVGYVNQFISEAEENYHIPSMGITVIYNDTMSYTVASGLQDIENGIAADPSITRFPIGSASKTFVYLSVMQLVEEGLIDLNKPVQTYIEIDLPFTKDDSVTVLDLMNHQGGFEEDLTGVVVGSKEEILPLKTFIIDYMPKQVRMAGTYSAYSNYGNTLLAYVVEQVAGINYEDYVQEHIFDVLGMTNTSIKQDYLNFAKGYYYNIERDAYDLQADYYWNIWPAGAVCATQEDMGIILSALMNGGAYKGKRILEEVTMEQLLQVTSAPKPNFNGLAHGLIQGSYNGYSYVGHGGTTPYHHTGFYFYPELGIGYAITSGGIDGRTANKAFIHGLIDTLYENKAIIPVANKEINIHDYAGAYSSTRSVDSNFQRILNWFQDELLVPEGDGLVRKSGVKMLPVSATTFISEDGNTEFNFELDNQRQPVGFYSSKMPIIYSRKLSSIASNGVQFQLLALIFLTMIIILLRRFITFIIRKIRKLMPKETYKRTVHISNGLLIYYLIAGIGLASGILLFDQTAFMKEEITLIRLALIGTAIIVPLGLFQFMRAIASIRNNCLSVYLRAEEIIVALAGIGLILWLQYWKLFAWYIG